MMKQIYITFGMLLVSAIAYFAGNRLFGKKRAGGWRLLSFLAGTTLGVLGAVGATQASGKELALSIGFALAGALLVTLSCFASNRTVRKIITGLLDGI
jgi:hypothetical protein